MLKTCFISQCLIIYLNIILLDENRRLSLFKLTENNDFTNRRVDINMDPSTLNILKQFKSEFPVFNKTEINLNQVRNRKNAKTLVLSKPPCVPIPSNADARIQQRRSALPIYSIRERILQAIDNHRIILIQGSVNELL